jgi:Rrf2 family protein
MRLTTKSRYGLRAVIQLTIDSVQEKRTTLASIAKRQCLSERYLEQIFSMLKKGGIVESVRGMKGGYYLAREPVDITVGDVLRVLEEPVEIVGCLKKDVCPKEDECVTYSIWKKIFDCMMSCADSINLKDVISVFFEEGNDTDGKKDDIFGPCCNNENEK